MLYAFCCASCEKHFKISKYTICTAARSPNKVSLDWAARHKIALGSARGIAYLHHDCIRHIIHRDIKSSNILLDEEMEARISDFGLATLINPDQTHVSTIVAGTFGYLATGECQILCAVFTNCI